ncbi:rhamnulokinase [Enterococcus mundtii]|uniref:rhamnulokinase n=1 Tax=Enterococcus mundtii TaxID=53346 RepID=UPI000D34B58C|nr:rhamnulokinase family protein [Enterococcus mundtii]PTO39975.1 rhamnulokinase [Enterococcus mundtii]PTO45298.1 rhamnulokinase [Enterococcus mundtii]
MKKNVLAFDFGASSGRAIIGIYEDDRLTLKEIHRFPNYPLEENGTLYWDIDYLFEQIKIGIRRATDEYSIDSLGIDTWGVDFGLLDRAGQLIKRPVNYRDPRTQGILAEAEKYMPLKDIYQQTGNQMMEINSLYQLLAERQNNPEFDQVATILFMPDLFNYLLTGKIVAERSIASTSQLVNPRTGRWDEKVLESFAFSESIFPPLVSSGESLGMIKKDLGLPPIKVVNVCGHDTASAVVSVPCNQEFLFISCGTWSLVGTELARPIINEKAYNYNLTNETGINYTTRFLKNCTGLWIIQEVKRNLAESGRMYSYSELANLADEASEFKCLIDTDDLTFIPPGNMIERIQQYAAKTKQAIPQTDGELVRCVYESLAMKYKYCILEIIDAVGKEFDTVNIVGGGSQAEILCQMVADASNMRVSAGPVEATAIGNISVQLLAEGVFKDVKEVREWIKELIAVKSYFPSAKKRGWDKQFSKYQQLLKSGEKANA